jgi:DNA-binding PadR family transcriptional regulator
MATRSAGATHHVVLGGATMNRLPLYRRPVYDGGVARPRTASRDEDPLAELGRYAGSATLVLSSLADGDKHGYALIQDVEAFAGVRLAPGTLYEALGRLERKGLIEALEPVGRRRPYRLTSAGARVLRAHLADQRQVAEVGLSRLGTRGATA